METLSVLYLLLPHCVFHLPPTNHAFSKQDLVHQSEKYKSTLLKNNFRWLCVARRNPEQFGRAAAEKTPGPMAISGITAGFVYGAAAQVHMRWQSSSCNQIHSCPLLSTPVWEKTGEPPRPPGARPRASGLIHSEKLSNLLCVLNTLGHMQRASQITCAHAHTCGHT